jgi:hypothetical protein
MKPWHCDCWKGGCGCSKTKKLQLGDVDRCDTCGATRPGASLLGTIALSGGAALLGMALASFSELGTPAPNTDCADAATLPCCCLDGTVSNVGASTTAPADDPFNTLYLLGVFSRQVWFSFTNPQSVAGYFRLSFHNPTGAAYTLAAALYTGTCDALEAVPNHLVADTDLSPPTFWSSIGAGADGGQSIGVVLEAGQTVYIELAGDDTGSPTGWNGALRLTWKLLEVTLKDTTSSLDIDTPPEALATWDINQSLTDPGLPNTGEAPAAYIHHQGLHFVAQPTNAQDNDLGYPAGFPSTDPGIWVRTVDATGALTAYPVDTEYAFDWNDHINSTVKQCCFEYLMTITHWYLFTQGIQFASDGENLWMGVIELAEVPYPYWFAGSIGDCVPDHDPADGELMRSNDPTPLPTGCSQGSGFSDAGVSHSGHWSVWRLAMYVWNGAGFTRIGDIDAVFFNRGGDSGDTDALASLPSLAASPAEPGVCHAIWAESGRWGQRDPGPGFWPNRGWRTNYSQWSSGGLIESRDLLYNDIIGATPTTENYYPPSDHMAWTAQHQVVNDGGRPLAFVNRQQTEDTGDTPPLRYAPMSGPTALELWDIEASSTNAPAVLQTLDGALLPQVSEVGITLTNFWSAEADASIFGAGYMLRRMFALSAPYVDATLDGEEVYLVIPIWIDAVTTGRRANGVYRVPVDGSAVFSEMDGDRAAAVEQAAASQFDFVSEPRNIWIPAAGAVDQFDRICLHDWLNDGIGQAIGEPNTSRQGNDSSRAPAESPPYYDPVTRTLYYASFIAGPTVETEKWGVGQTKIVTAICTVGECLELPTGMHLWQRITPG